MPVIINEFTVEVMPPAPSETTPPAGGAPGGDAPSYCQRLHEPAIAAERRERLTAD